MTEKTEEFRRSLEKRSSLKYTLNACKLDWDENIFDFYVGCPEKCPQERSPPEKTPEKIAPRKYAPQENYPRKNAPWKIAPWKIVLLDFCCF